MSVISFRQNPTPGGSTSDYFVDFVSPDRASCAGDACCFLSATAQVSTPGVGIVVEVDAGNDISPTQSWTAGNRLSVSADGAAGLGAFSGSITSVGQLSGVVPPLSFASGTTIPLAQDLVVHWTPDAASLAGETVQVSLNASGSTQLLRGTIVCRSSDASGLLTIPASLLANFQSSDTGAVVIDRFAIANTNLATVSVQSTTEALGYTHYQ